MDAHALEASYKRLQRQVHPDYFGGLSAAEQESAALASSTLNVAYHTLRCPLGRAQYLLTLSGADALGEGAGSRAVAPELLMQVMEARELVGDPDTGTGELAALLERTRRAHAACIADLSAAFSARDVPRALSITVALSYYGKLAAEASEAQGAREEAAAAAAKEAGPPPGVS